MLDKLCNSPLVSMILVIPLAALLLYISQGPSKEPIWNCIDRSDGHQFQFSPSQTTDEVTNLTGEDYGYYTEPNGIRHRISRSWVEEDECQVIGWKEIK